MAGEIVLKKGITEIPHAETDAVDMTPDRTAVLVYHGRRKKLMPPAAEKPEMGPGLLDVTRLVENLPIESEHLVGPEHQPPGISSGNPGCLEFRKGVHHVAGGAPSSASAAFTAASSTVAGITSNSMPAAASMATRAEDPEARISLSDMRSDSLSTGRGTSPSIGHAAAACADSKISRGRKRG